MHLDLRPDHRRVVDKRGAGQPSRLHMRDARLIPLPVRLDLDTQPGHEPAPNLRERIPAGHGVRYLRIEQEPIAIGNRLKPQHRIAAHVLAIQDHAAGRPS